MGIENTIKDENNESPQNRAKAMIFLRHHLHDGLKIEYLTIKDPLDLWNNLKERYSHQKTVILPKTRYDWMHLRLQDFKSVSEYNSALFRISSQLKLCGEKITDDDFLEKTYSTFHASNVLLQQQYREKGFKKYSELISCLLVAEQNNELLMKNHEIRPTRANPFPEVNVAMHDEKRKQNKTEFGRGSGHGHGRGRDRGRGRGRGRGRERRRGRFHPYNRGHEEPRDYSHSNQKNTNYQKWGNDQAKKVEIGQNNMPKKSENECYRCGIKGHWYQNCRTPKHLVDPYQASKEKARDIETNFIYQSEDLSQVPSFSAPFDVSDFFEDPDGRIDHLIGDGSVQNY
ncbi:uncharacterized protein [Henckelia pumila]|uniref:uncharacterized protein n=1 Tax=Henckelia pumila TaxID=405737 RepID=UPI003C6E5173